MKILNTLLIFLFFASAFGQEVPKKDGCIEIKKVNHYFFRNKNGEQTNKKSNKANRPHLLLYLDTLGNIIEKAGYGKHHNTDLRLLDFVEQNEFENGKLISTIKYDTDYDKNIKAIYKTKYIYNNTNQLIQEIELYYSTDSLFMKFDYEYDSIGNRTKTFFNPTYYYSRTFDKQSNIQSLQQIYNSKLQWEWKYTHSDTMRIGEFKTYYNDGKNYTKKEIRRYKNRKLIEVEEKHTSEKGLSYKTVFHYDKYGIINKIDYFEAYSNDTSYHLRSYTEIKTKHCIQLTAELIENINNTIYDE